MYSSAVFKKPDNFSLKMEPDMEYTTHEHYIKVCSSGRNSTAYPLHYDYKINLPNKVKNIVSAQIVSCVIPDVDILDEPIVVFDIEELNYIDFLFDGGYKKIFTSFPISEPNANNHTFINLKAASPILNFKTPLASISTLTVKLYDINYQPLTFGSPGGSTAKALQHSFLLKFVVAETPQKQIDYRKTRRDD